MGMYGLRNIWVFCVLIVIASSVLAKPRLKKITQLVIVYAPEKDHNTAFSRFDEETSLLIDAAKSKNLRVVLINADHFDGPRSAELLKGAVESAVKANPSVVLLATHGGNQKTKSGGDDTSLSFGDGMLFSDIADSSLNSENLGGVILQSCHGDNDKLKELGAKTMACGSSVPSQTSRMSILYSQHNALSAAIQMGEVPNLVAHMK